MITATTNDFVIVEGESSEIGVMLPTLLVEVMRKRRQQERLDSQIMDQQGQDNHVGETGDVLNAELGNEDVLNILQKFPWHFSVDHETQVKIYSEAQAMVIDIVDQINN